MNVTTSGLTKAAGAAAAVAGAIFIGVQINHPPLDVASVETTEVVVRDTVKVRHGRPGAGRHHRHVPAARSAATESSAWSATSCSAPATCVILGHGLRRRVRPPRRSPRPNPAYVNDLLDAADGGTSSRRHRRDAVAVQPDPGIGYLVGGLIFGIALFRAGVLARWAAALLAVGTVVTAALAVLPDAFNRPLAVPERHRADRSRRLPVAQPAPDRRADRSDDRPRRAQPGPMTIQQPLRDPGPAQSRGWPVPAGAGRPERRPARGRAPCG